MNISIYSTNYIIFSYNFLTKAISPRILDYSRLSSMTTLISETIPMSTNSIVSLKIPRRTPGRNAGNYFEIVSREVACSCGIGIAKRREPIPKFLCKLFCGGQYVDATAGQRKPRANMHKERNSLKFRPRLSIEEDRQDR